MFLKKVLDLLNKINDRQAVGKFVKPQEILQEFNEFSISQDGLNDDEILKNIGKYLSYSVNSGSGKFLNQLFGGRDESAVAGELIAAYLNNTMATYEMAPVASLLEEKIIENVANLIGFKNFDGKFVSGGSYANIAAMMCARNKIDEEIKSSGLNKTITAFVSKDAHYCFLKAANLLGIGTKNLVAVDVDENGRMSAKDLEEKILNAKKENKLPFFIGITLGTTVRGTFDDVNEIAKIAQKYNLWLHGDGAYGAPVIFSAKHKHLMNGAEKLDSLAIDFHKILGAPLTASAIIFNDKKNITNEVFDVGHGEYIFHEWEYREFDQGHKSLQCGRKVDALKVWLMMISLGKKGLEERINYLFELANYAHAKIKSDENFRIIFAPNFLNICFQYLPKNISDEKQISNFNEKLRYKILQSGECFINYSVSGEKKFFRLVTVNFKTTKQDIDEVLNLIKKLALKNS